MANKLMVVAHPDDEAIFGGAHLLKYSQWKVVCITNGAYKQRAAEFAKAMRLVGADYEMWNYRDTRSYDFNQSALKRDLQHLIRKNHFRTVVTHGIKGEYGHPQHKVIFQILHRIVKRNLYTFSISDKRLPDTLLEQKKQLLAVYQSQQRTISELKLDDYIKYEGIQRVK